MDQTNRRAFAARYTEPSGRRWVAEEVARLETVVPSIDGPSPRVVLRFTSEDSISEQRFTRCGPLGWTSPEIIDALFLSARPIRPIPEPTPPGGPRRRAVRGNRRRNGPPGWRAAVRWAGVAAAGCRSEPSADETRGSIHDPLLLAALTSRFSAGFFFW